RVSERRRHWTRERKGHGRQLRREARLFHAPRFGSRRQRPGRPACRELGGLSREGNERRCAMIRSSTLAVGAFLGLTVLPRCFYTGAVNEPSKSLCKDGAECASVAFRLVDANEGAEATQYFERACALDPAHGCGAAGAHQRMYGSAKG